MGASQIQWFSKICRTLSDLVGTGCEDKLFLFSIYADDPVANPRRRSTNTTDSLSSIQPVVMMRQECVLTLPRCLVWGKNVPLPSLWWEHHVSKGFLPKRMKCIRYLSRFIVVIGSQVANVANVRRGICFLYCQWHPPFDNPPIQMGK